MKIKQILSSHRNDFTALMECEHCGHTGKLGSGYNDDHYHQRVIPAMQCAECGKNRTGEVGHTDDDVSPMVI
jgi:hypothetical protein